MPKCIACDYIYTGPVCPECGSTSGRDIAQVIDRMRRYQLVALTSLLALATSVGVFRIEGIPRPFLAEVLLAFFWKSPSTWTTRAIGLVGGLLTVLLMPVIILLVRSAGVAVMLSSVSLGVSICLWGYCMLYHAAFPHYASIVVFALAWIGVTAGMGRTWLAIRRSHWSKA